MDLYGDYYKILKGSKDPVLHQPVERNRIFHRISLLHFPLLAACELWKKPGAEKLENGGCSINLVHTKNGTFEFDVHFKLKKK